jgi:hypothetical protein
MGRMSTQEYEELRRGQEGKDYSVTPKLGPRTPKLSRTDWERIGRVLSDWVRS